MAAHARKSAAWDRAGACGRCTYSFVGPVMRRGKAFDLQDTDLDSLPSRDRVATVTDRLEKEWRAELVLRPAAPSLWRALYRAERRSFWISAVYCFLESSTCIGQPVVFGVFLNWLTSPLEVNNLGPGLAAALGLALIALAQIFIHHQLYYFTMRGGWNARIACTALVHRKLLRTHSAALGGEDSNDGTRKLFNDVFHSLFFKVAFGVVGPLIFLSFSR